MSDVVARARAALEGITPGPWFYDSYSLVACPQTIGGYYEWEGELLDAGHSVDKTACEVCDNTIRCDHWKEAYYREPIVAHVPAFAGDSAHGRHAHDASFIAAAPELVAELATEVDRLQRWKDEAVERLQEDKLSADECPHTRSRVFRTVPGPRERKCLDCGKLLTRMTCGCDLTVSTNAVHLVDEHEEKL